MSDYPQWFDDWLKDQLPTNRALGSSFARPTKSLTIPSNAKPGDARIVLGTELPPPLDTYIVNPYATRFAAAIIFYMGTPTDDDYAYIGIVGVGGPFVSLIFGSVVNGVIAERRTGSGFPAGFQMDTTNALESFLVMNLTENLAGNEGTGGLMIGAAGRQDIRVAPGPLKTWSDQTIPSPSPQQTTSNVFAPWSPSPSIGGFVKVYNDSEIKVTLVGSGFVTVAAGTRIGYALRDSLNLVTYPIGAVFINPVSTHTYFQLTKQIAGLPSGNYGLGLTAWWRRDPGGAAGTCQMDSNDSMYMEVKEVAP